MDKSEIKNKKISVLGAGRSGMAAAKLLARNGAQIFLSDGTDIGKLPYFSETELKEAGVEFETGNDSDKIYNADLLITSPGIKPNSEILQKALAKNIKVISEVEAASWFCKAPIAGITGTNGKTTTTELTGEIFRASGRKTEVCGNVGVAFSEVAENLDENSFAILELSSFQLENINELKPNAAVILNITPDHIDWHGSLESYTAAKFKINMNQDDNDLFVINADDEVLLKHSKDANGIKAGITLGNTAERNIFERGCYLKNDEIIYFDKKSEEKIINKDEIKIKGDHNIYNSMAGITIAKHFGISNEIISKALNEFSGVEHRLEPSGTIKGITFYNDSKATNIDSLKVALKTFKENVILILGGKKSDNDYSGLKELVSGRVKKIIALGEDKEKIFSSMSGFVKVEKSETFENAVRAAYHSASSGDVVLFSPACKSFDMFNNYEERGKEFKRIVQSIKNE